MWPQITASTKRFTASSRNPNLIGLVDVIERQSALSRLV